MKKRYGALVLLFSVLLLSPATSDPVDTADTANGAGSAGAGEGRALADRADSAGLSNEAEGAEADLNGELVLPEVPVTAWFVSNEMGQALESVYALVALREPYALSVMPVAGEFVPDEYWPYYDAAWSAECRTLYEEGELLRIQWVFTDENSMTRFVSAKSPEGDGFTEVYNEDGLLTEESRFDASASVVEAANEEGELVATEPAPSAVAEPLVVRYTYQDRFLISAQSAEWSDVYRYTRNNQIRVIERTYLETKARSRVTLPRTITDISFNGSFFVAPVSSYTSVFLKDVLVNTGVDAGYTLDDKGRILVETRRDEEGNVIGTLTNIWDEDRIRRVVWESEGDNRRVEYAYDEDGERVRETNYRDGTLEREVDVNGDEETETLYRKGEAVLRAVWQDGRKVREESLRMTEHRPAARRRGS